MRGEDSGGDPKYYSKLNDYAITRMDPWGSCNWDIMWVYEIDLDNEVFHGMQPYLIHHIPILTIYSVNSQPLFRLDNMPGAEVFIDSIGYDSLIHMAT